jgi:hypothetical protein
MNHRRFLFGDIVCDLVEPVVPKTRRRSNLRWFLRINCRWRLKRKYLSAFAFELLAQQAGFDRILAATLRAIGSYLHALSLQERLIVDSTLER